MRAGNTIGAVLSREHDRAGRGALAGEHACCAPEPACRDARAWQYDRVACARVRACARADQRASLRARRQHDWRRALIAAALALNISVVAHNASFDVARLNHTALKHKLKLAPLTSASLLCTMHTATKHCDLRKRGGKSLKPPAMRSYMNICIGASRASSCIGHCRTVGSLLLASFRAESSSGGDICVRFL